MSLDIFSCGWEEAGGGVYSCHAWPQSYGHRPSHPYMQCRDGARRVITDRADIACAKAQSTVACLASRMKGELHPTKNHLRGTGGTLPQHSLYSSMKLLAHKTCEGFYRCKADATMCFGIWRTTGGHTRTHAHTRRRLSSGKR